MTLPVVEPKRCDVLGCTARFATRGSRRRCDEHRGRAWLELWIARQRAGLTVAELADRAGIPLTYVHHLQSGARVAGDAHVHALAEALGVDRAALAARADTVVPDELLAVAGRLFRTGGAA